MTTWQYVFIFLIWPILEARAEIRAGKKVPTWANSALEIKTCGLSSRVFGWVQQQTHTNVMTDMLNWLEMYS